MHRYVLLVLLLASQLSAQERPPHRDLSHLRLAGIDFIGVKIFTPAQARAEFPIKDGEPFNVAKVRRGLDRLRDKYNRLGYLNFVAALDTVEDSDLHTVRMRLDVDEGAQYLIGDLHVTGGPDAFRAQLLRDWEPLKGQPPDGVAYARFFSQHRRLLPKPYLFMPAIEARRDEQTHRIESYLIIDERKW